jgi:drug/metabolite transporter (DMT)-like permease
VKAFALSPIVYDYLANLLRIPAMLPAALRRGGLRDSWSRHRGAILLVAAISPLGYVLVLYAARLAPLSHVAPAREVSMLIAAVVGGNLFGEGDRARRRIGAVAIAGGVIAIALAK